MRASALWVVLAIVVSPLVFVLVSGFLEAAFVDRTLDRAVTTSDEVAALVRRSAASTEAVDAIARRRDQRVRLVAPDGSTTVDCDHLVGHSWLFAVGDLVYGPDRASTLAAFDEARGPLGARAEIAAARESGNAVACEHEARGNLEVCQVAERISPGGLVVHVEGSSRRALESLYESRRQLLKLTLFVLVLALPLWWWMVRRMVRPLEALRAEVLSRADAAVPRADLAVARRDEIGDLTAAFNTLLAALGERERATEAFVADLAHELKNPVATVRACAERLADSTPRERSDAEVQRTNRLADALDKSASRLDAIVSQLLELARAEAALPNEAREEVDVAAIARGIATNGATERGARIELVDSDAPATVRGVPLRIESVLRNLVDNGLAFAGDGGWVRVTLERGASITIVVEDSGPGIPVDDLPRVFDRFYTTRGATRGTGLGLALVRAVVEAHGGTVVAESPAGQGARFVVTLPAFTRASHPIH
jgi:signal transduction histidine kinase